MIHTTSEVRTRESGRAMIVEISGHVGSHCPSVEELERRAGENRSRLAIFDLSKAERIDSHGLEWLEQVAAKLEPTGVAVRVVAPEGSRVGRMLKLMKFDRFVLVLATVFDALTFGRRRRKRS